LTSCDVGGLLGRVRSGEMLALVVVAIVGLIAWWVASGAATSMLIADAKRTAEHNARADARATEMVEQARE